MVRLVQGVHPLLLRVIATTFRTLPSLPILVGGALILAGGAITTFWRPT
jgi:hypothetical protein